MIQSSSARRIVSEIGMGSIDFIFSLPRAFADLLRPVVHPKELERLKVPPYSSQSKKG